MINLFIAQVEIILNIKMTEEQKELFASEILDFVKSVVPDPVLEELEPELIETQSGYNIAVKETLINILKHFNVEEENFNKYNQ